MRRIVFLLSLALLVTAGGVQAAQTGGPAYLTGPNDGDPVDIAIAYVQANRASLGLEASDLQGLRVERYPSSGTGMTHVRLIQRHAGIDVDQADLLINVAADGSIINLHNRFVPGLSKFASESVPHLTAVEAVERAAADLGLAVSEPLVVERSDQTAERATLVSNGGISREAIPARLVWSHQGEVRLAWDLSIHQISADHWWSLRVDAASGVVVDRIDWVVHETFTPAGSNGGIDLATGGFAEQEKGTVIDPQYLVYPWPVESPNYAIPAPPADARTLVVNPQNSASPYGWHDTDGVDGAEYTTTQGNNVDAQKNGVEADCGAGLDCSFVLDLTQAPTSGSNVDAAIANLFYWNNVIHDVWHTYGFDEASGNFQENNYGNGGQGGDSVTANAQASGNCNANFGTPPDGGNPTMNMYTCDIANPARDGDLDNGVIAHEYAHGISNRLTGGPANTSCLNNSEQMGEGWSDWYGLIMTIEAGDLGTDPRGIGTWLLGQGPTGQGVRTQRYSTDIGINDLTYSDIGSMAIPHGVGEVWAIMLWEMTWNLIDEYGLNPNIDDHWSSGGNNLAMQLVTDGMKLQPCSPGFVDGRDAILLADQNLTGGANQCLIWEAFAKRGLGYSANQGSSSSTGDGTQAFDIPPSCDFLNPNPLTADACVGSEALFSIEVNDSFTPPVTMSVQGLPAGAGGSFSPNPVAGPLPMATTLTVDSLGAGAVGTHTLTVTGNDGVNNESVDLELNVFPTALAAPTLLAPADGATNVGPMPMMMWSEVTGTQAYRLEIDDDPGFASVDYDVSIAETTHQVTTFLDALTTYYWRVTPVNTCVIGTTSAVYSFTTPNISCGSFSSGDLPLPIPQGGDSSGTTIATLDVAEVGEIASLTVTLAGDHTYMGDLDFTLESPAGTSVVIIEQSCSGDNDFDLTLDDMATDPFPCPPVGGGTYLPSNPLSPFVGEEVSGQWTLTITDHYGGDTGSIQTWDLNVCVASAGEPPLFADGFESGDMTAWSTSTP